MTVDDIKAHIEGLQAQLAAHEAKINPLKAERDAFVATHRAVYEQEREYAAQIKALQAPVGPIAAELKALRLMMSGA